MDETIVILEQKKVFWVKRITNFVSFDWSREDWKDLLPHYEDWLIKIFTDEQPFETFESATQYASYLVMESEHETETTPECEIIQLSR